MTEEQKATLARVGIREDDLNYRAKLEELERELRAWPFGEKEDETKAPA